MQDIFFSIEVDERYCKMENKNRNAMIFRKIFFDHFDVTSF